ncbi:hypothetical protein [Nonomuraea sp. NPDC001023]|uniref:hypothetical protein n=1 Tax=unclassified Nonomuraea TaxID=2593643 RepID=UPI00332EDC6E
MPSSSADSPAVTVIAPARSSPRAPASRLSASRRSAATTATTPIGALISRIQRQDR